MPPPKKYHSRGCRGGYKEQRRRLSRDKPEDPEEQDGSTSVPQQQIAAGDAPPQLNVTLTNDGREVASVSSLRVQSGSLAVPQPQPPVRRALFTRDEEEYFGAVYDTTRGRLIGQMTVFGRPLTGHMSMGSQAMDASPVNVTFLSPGDPITRIGNDVLHGARAYVALLDPHQRTPGGMMWFDRASFTWTHHMELSFQPGSVLFPGEQRIRVLFERPILERQ